MLRSRRFALVAVVTILGLSACGDGSDTTAPADAPAVIVLGAGGASTPASAEASPNGGAADRSMMIGNITYVFDGTYPDLGAAAPSWTLPAGAAADAATVARIAAVLGVDGEPRQLPADQGGGWMVGPADYSGATVTVSSDGMVSWWYSPAPTARGGATDCVYPDKAIAEEPAASTDGGSAGGASTGAGGGTDAVAPVDTTDVVSEPIPPCAEPTPPAGVPTKAEAEAKATQLLGELGLDPADFELTSYADEWGANVTAWLTVGGFRSPLQVNVGYGAEGALQWASGTLATPAPSSEYPLITPEAALARLNDQNGMWWGGYYGAMGVADMARDAVGAAETQPAPSDSAVVDTALVDPMPPEMMPPATIEPVTVTLVSVRLDMTMVWAADGTIWLLPAYTFTSTDGGEYTVIAVEDQYIQQPEPIVVDTTVPVVDTTTPTVPVDTTAPVVIDTTTPTDPVDTTPVSEPTPVEVTAAEAALVGLTLEEATKVAEGSGWQVRTSTLDGEPQIMTDDYIPTRVNVAVTDGIVTAVDSVG